MIVDIESIESVRKTVPKDKFVQFGLNYQAVLGDGHCLFHAVGLYVNQDQRALRKIVTTYLENHIEELRGFIETNGRTINEYIQSVREGREWANNLEIEILMRVLNRPIIVICPDRSIRNPGDLDRFSGEPIFTYYNDHNHYDGLTLASDGSNGREIFARLAQSNERSQRIHQIPVCAEKIILLLYHSESSISIESDVITLKTLLPSRTHEIDRIQSYWNLKNYKDYHESLQRLLTSVMPFNIGLLRSLIKKMKSFDKQVNNQDVLLLLGRSGVGKSTITHFLAGSKMEEQQNNGVDHITPIEVFNKYLKEIETNSEINSVKAIPISFSDINLPREGGIVICDTKGNESVQCLELDVANSIVLVETIRNAKSIRPVVVISRKSSGDRSEFIKSLLQFLMTIFNNIETHLDSFSFIFTKYPKNELNEINPTLKSIKNNLSVTEKSSPEFLELISSMIQATEDRILSVDPISDKPKNLMKQLLKATPIKHPQEGFQFSIPENAMSILREQIMLHQLSIRQSFSDKQYDLMFYKLEELNFLSKYFKQDFIQKSYSLVLESIKEKIEGQFRSAVDLINDFCNQDNSITHAILAQYLSYINEFKKIETLNPSLLDISNPWSERLAQCAVLKANELAIRNQEDKLKKMSELISETQSIYQSYLKSLATDLKTENDILRTSQRNILRNSQHRVQLSSENVEFTTVDLFEEIIPNRNCEFSEELNMINLIKTIFNPNNQILRDLKLLISSYEKTKDKIFSLSHKKGIEYLSDKGFQSFSDLKGCIIEIETEIYTIGSEIAVKQKIRDDKNNLLSQLNSILSSYNSMLIQPGFTYAFKYLYYFLGSQFYTTQNIWVLAKNYLNSQGYQDVLDLKRKIMEIESEISELDAFLNDKKSRLKEIEIRLNDNRKILKKYDEIFKSRKKLFDIRVNEFFLEKGFGSVDEIKNKVSMLEEEMSCSLIQLGLKPSVYSGFDLNFAERAYNFLLKSEKNDPALEQDYNAAISTFLLFLDFYCKSIKIKFSEFRSKALIYNAFEIQIMLPEVLELVRELKLINDNYEALSNFFPRRILDEFLDDIRNFCIELSDQLLSFEQVGHLSMFLSKLEVVKLLTAFDEIVPGKLFYSLYKESRRKFYEEINRVIQFCQISIESNQFDELKIHLSILRKLADLDSALAKQAFSGIKIRFSLKLQELMSELKQCTILLCRENCVTEINKIVKKLKIIQTAHDSGSDYFSSELLSSYSIVKFIDEIKDTLSKFVGNHIQFVKLMIDNFDFFEAEENIKIANQLIHVSKLYLNEDFEEEVISFSEKIKQRLQDAINLYSDMNIQDYVHSLPSKILTKIQKLEFSGLNDYRIALDRIKTAIIAKFENELLKLKDMTNELDRKKIIKQYRLCLQTLTEDLRQQLLVKLEDSIEEVNYFESLVLTPGLLS